MNGSTIPRIGLLQYDNGVAKLDHIHDAVKNALVKAGWTITHDPFKIEFEELKLYADLAAERTLAAERDGEKIAVEVKSFIGRSKVRELEEALGQYSLYLGFLEVIEPDRKLYLAVSRVVYENFFSQKAIQFAMRRHKLALIVVNVPTEEVVAWINPRSTAI